ncbi:hypothetical protein B0H13DRAFT_2316699 [Mycena leptocephala]|nr:hypothetical protein B0H13DRAFT_2316699 [Mycena leptocephala]
MSGMKGRDSLSFIARSLGYSDATRSIRWFGGPPTLCIMTNPTVDIDHTSDSDYDAEDEPSKSELDDESDDEYLAIPEPSTWLATHSLDSELQVQPPGTIQVHSMRDAELHFAGPINKKGGAKDKTGKLRGAYLVGGISQREAE